MEEKYKTREVCYTFEGGSYMIEVLRIDEYRNNCPECIESSKLVAAVNE